MQVYKEGKKVLLGGGWLSDNLISAAQSLLRNDYPNVGGLQPTIFGETLNFEVQKGKFVQVLNVYGSHWITISNMCSSDVVSLYGSMQSCTLGSQTKRQIASILMTDKESVNYH